MLFPPLLLLRYILQISLFHISSSVCCSAQLLFCCSQNKHFLFLKKCQALLSLRNFLFILFFFWDFGDFNFLSWNPTPDTPSKKCKINIYNILDRAHSAKPVIGLTAGTTVWPALTENESRADRIRGCASWYNQCHCLKRHYSGLQWVLHIHESQCNIPHLYTGTRAWKLSPIIHTTKRLPHRLWCAAQGAFSGMPLWST